VNYWTPDYSLRYFLRTTDENGIKRRVEGRFDAPVLSVKTTLGDRVTQEDYPLPEGVDFLEKVSRDAWAERGLRVGDSYTVQVFSLDFLSIVDLSVEVLREEVIPYQGDQKPVFVVAFTLAGMTTLSWMDREGAEYKEEVMGLLVAVRTNPEEALSAIEGFDVLLSSGGRVPIVGELPPPGSTRLEVKVTLKEGAVRSLFPPSERQTVIADEGVSEGVLQIDLIDLEGADILPLPIQGDPFEEYLKSTVYVEADDPQIVEQAQKIMGAENDAWEVVKKLCTWVFQNVREKSYEVGFASARQTLASREGDCSEHAVLFAALARAVGLPTQLCAGIVLVSDGFGYYHAWVEVYVGRWVAVDPTWNQPQADAMHLELVKGGGDESFLMEMGIGVFRTMDKLAIEVLKGGSVTVVQGEEKTQPTAYVLYQNHPNPFNRDTVIRFALPLATRVDLAVFNLAGQPVATLSEGWREAGTYLIRWEGRDADGQKLASGVYLYRLTAGEQSVETRKLVLMK
jgi:hypothetical protein